MANMLLTVQHKTTLFTVPVQDEVKIERERVGSPGKLTFTTVATNDDKAQITEGDAVCFYYDDKPVFMGYVFTKKCDRSHNLTVTCYDQIRYLKNKYSYAFENKTATEIIKALANDLNLNLGTMVNTNYIIPTIVEENSAALDIILSALEDTLLNTGNMFVVYDDFGKLTLSNTLDMISNVLIMSDTAENFNYSSSIDNETYNSIVLHHKDEDKKITVYTASNNDKINEWGVLRYFEEVKDKSIAQNKANALLKLYCRKTREFKIKNAFGDINIRGGTLIPVRLDLGDISTNNYMIVESVTHKFNKDYYTMDLTLDGAWED